MKRSVDGTFDTVCNMCRSMWHRSNVKSERRSFPHGKAEPDPWPLLIRCFLAEAK